MTPAERYPLVALGRRFYLSRGSGGRRRRRDMEIVEVVGPIVPAGAQAPGAGITNPWRVQVRTVRPWRSGAYPVGHERPVAPSRLVPGEL